MTEQQITEAEVQHYPDLVQSIGIAAIVIAGMLVFSPVLMFLDNFIDAEAAGLVYYLLAIGGPFWIVYMMRRNRTDIRSFNVTLAHPRIIPFIIVATPAILFGIVTPINSLIPMPEEIKKAFMDIGGRADVFTFAQMVIAAPVLEELIFRGIMLDGLLKFYTPLKSILISSILFGVVHLNPWQLVTGIIFGAFSGWIYYHTRSVLPSIICHGTANACGFIMMSFADSVEPANESLLATYGGIENFLLATTAMTAIIAICILFLKREFAKVVTTEAAETEAS